MRNRNRIIVGWRRGLWALLLIHASGHAAWAGKPLEAGHGVEPAAGDGRHPFVQTVADVFVNRSSITVRISSSADELDLIHGIIPLENGKYDTQELLEGVDIHADFLLERFEIYNSAGNRLQGRLAEKPAWEIPQEGLASGRLIDYMLDYTFEYQLEQPPEFLTFQNYIIDYNFALPSEVKLLVKQAGSDVPYADVLKIKQPKTVRFDWDQPLSNLLTGDELRAWFDDTREKTLGLTSYGGVYSFIYVTPREVRHEVLLPLANLNEFLRFQQADPWYLEVEEQDLAEPQIREFFSEGNPVTVNGRVVQPRFDRIDFGGLDVRDFGRVRQRKRISLANGRVGVIMSYPTRNIPDEVTVTWNKFSKMLKDVDVVLIGPDDKVEKKQFSRYLSDNTVVWTNPGIPPLPEVVDVQVEASAIDRTSDLPLVSMIALLALVVAVLMMLFRSTVTRGRVGFAVLLLAVTLFAWPVRTPVTLPFATPAPIRPEDAATVFSTLHTNLFRSFDYKTEDDVYDALARTTDGPLLKKIYLDMRRSLEVQEQGGAVSNIDRIEIVDGRVAERPVGEEPLVPPDFAFHCTWELEGTVEHWGHIHRRTNRYEALFNVANIDGLWKFTEFQAINEEQGQIVRSLRKF
jgi:hypothetical protein